jgi:hypothetical protein
VTKEFSVCQFFVDDSHEYLGRHLSDEDAVRLAVQATRSVGATIGTTKRVIITDGGDCINWEWKHGEGVVYPPQLVSRPVCPTCGEPYSRDPSPRASICSSGFHCCRDCAWVDGSLVQPCAHHDVESCADCARRRGGRGYLTPSLRAARRQTTSEAR